MHLNIDFSPQVSDRLAAAGRLRARLAAEATDDPDMIRKAQEELDAMKRSMNAERVLSGAEPIF